MQGHLETELEHTIYNGINMIRYSGTNLVGDTEDLNSCLLNNMLIPLQLKICPQLTVCPSVFSVPYLWIQPAMA